MTAPSPSCPTCGSAIDPLRAPVARVAGGRIVTYCSKACADGKPASAPAPAPSASSREDAARGVPVPVAETSAAQSARREIVIEVDDDEPRHTPDRRRRRNRRVLWLVGAILAGGAALVVIQQVAPTSPSPVAAEKDASRRAAPAPAVDAAPVFDPSDPAQVRERAIAALRALIVVPEKGRVPRIAREAARALARTGDGAAREALVRALQYEPSEIARLDVAYALARGGDDRGTAVLVEALRSPRRDVRADAARYLVVLGDRRGVPTLETMLSIHQLKVGAAVSLARIDHAEAIEVLDAVRTDPRSSHEEKLRALVALGLAGKAQVADELRARLDDNEQNVGAAQALARLRDPAAAPVLVRQLGVPSLQVEAAVALRRLDASFDPSPHLPALVTALDSGKDTLTVPAAEAILVLTGPADQAERD